jgi:ABC-type uncharacterized transport system permease subunit
MEVHVKRYLIKIFLLLCMCLIWPLLASAEIDWHTQRTVRLEKEPIDVVMSARGSYMFVLTGDGIIYIYNSTGKLKGQIDAGKNIDSIACGPDEKLLILKSSKDKEVRSIVFEFLQEIDIKGSPFKGNVNAPVIIVVFTDYQ